MLFAHRVRQSSNALASITKEKPKSAMATTKARTIKLADLASVIDRAVETSAGRRIAGGTIIGRQIAASLAAKINPEELARDITKELKASFPDVRLTPKVIKGDDLTTIGFIMKPIKTGPIGQATL